MKCLDHHNWLVSITHSRLAFIIGAGAVAWFALLAASRARSDSYWWPYQKALAAFSLKIEVTDYKRKAGGEVREVDTQAKRSDGTTVVIATLYLPQGPPHTLRVIRLPDGGWIKLVDALSAKSTCRPKLLAKASARKTLSSAPKPDDCVRPLDKLLGQTELFGQRAEIVKTWDLGSGGEKWVVPGLGCMVLQWQRAELRPNGSRTIQEEGKPVSLILGEPEARLFDMGASYNEVKPSELLRLEMRAAGRPWSPLMPKETRDDYEYDEACVR